MSALTELNGWEKECMDCGLRTSDLVPTSWSHDPNGEIRCTTCTLEATHRLDRCRNCGHDRWEHSGHCLAWHDVGDYGEYSIDCACQHFEEPQ